MYRDINALWKQNNGLGGRSFLFSQGRVLLPPLPPGNVFLNHFKCPKTTLQCRSLEFSFHRLCEKRLEAPRGSPGTRSHFFLKPFIKSQIKRKEKVKCSRMCLREAKASGGRKEKGFTRVWGGHRAHGRSHGSRAEPATGRSRAQEPSRPARSVSPILQSWSASSVHRRFAGCCFPISSM